MNRTIFALAAAAALLAGCATTPMNQDVLLDSTGSSTRNVAFDRCMREAGFSAKAQ